MMRKGGKGIILLLRSEALIFICFMAYNVLDFCVLNVLCFSDELLLKLEMVQVIF